MRSGGKLISLGGKDMCGKFNWDWKNGMENQIKGGDASRGISTKKIRAGGLSENP
jgi:hypothetical protein